jgi:hypothetical protein
LNFTGNRMLLSGRSNSVSLKSSASYSSLDPFLVSLGNSDLRKVGGGFSGIHPIGIGLPFKFEFSTYGGDISTFEGSTKIKKINVPSWTNITTDSKGNGFALGFSPSEKGTFPLEFDVQFMDSSVVSYREKIIVLDDGFTPVLILPKKLNLKQSLDFEVPFYVENVVSERLKFSSNFPDWIEIVSTNSNEYLLRGRPESNAVGEEQFKLSVSTLSGLSDYAEITVNVDRNIQTSLLKQEDDLNTWSNSWIGSAYFLGNGWAYHAYLGWIFIQPDQVDTAWIWTDKWNWLWVSKKFWDGAQGNLFSKELDQWVFIRFDDLKNRNLLYNYQVGRWYNF